MVSESEANKSAMPPGDAGRGGGGTPVVEYKSILPRNAALRSAASWVRFLVPAALGLAADLALKRYAFPDGVPTAAHEVAGRNPALPGTEPWAVIPGLLGFHTTVNQGAVFGWAQGQVMVFLGFSVVALAIIVWVFISSLRSQRVVHIALGMITAGALGNLYDRAVYHGVRDMLRFYVDWYPYIFNIADVLLCVGVPLLIARWLFVKDKAVNGAV